jgi:hypothetical protein
MTGHDAEYILPLLRRDRGGERALVRYLKWVHARMDVTVVDGSEADLFAALHDLLPPGVQHFPPRHRGLNGKACGVMTGIEVARHERLVLADDDVRYTDRSLTDLLDRLDGADLIRPQNVYTAYPWHAQYDTARMLIGRAFGGDFGGTLAVRRSVILAAGGYNTNVLFENLELERTIRCAGGRVQVARDLYVPRTPPTMGHFRSQRVRQAYDSFAQPARMITELALLPALLIGARTGGWCAVAGGAGAVMALAVAGRRVGRGSGLIPARTILWAPAWAVERAVTVWIAVLMRARGGVRYAGSRIFAAATPLSTLQRTTPRLRGEQNE